MIRIVVADDQALIVQGLSVLLSAEADLEVVGTAEDGVVAWSLIRELVPDVALLDIRMPLLDGLEVAARVHRDNLPTRTVMLTTFDLDEYVLAALRVGASGFLLKDLDRAQLVAAVRAAATGDAVLSPAVLRRVLARVGRDAPSSPSAATALRLLTERERQVLVLLGAGRTNAEIAAELFISPTTVKSHVASILAKLHLRDRVQAVIFAYENGLADPPGRTDGG